MTKQPQEQPELETPTSGPVSDDVLDAVSGGEQVTVNITFN